MTLKELVALARDKDPGFRMSYDYRVNVRKKAPDFDWLMKGIELALGIEFVCDAVQEELDRLEDEREANIAAFSSIKISLGSKDADEQEAGKEGL